jgi:maleylacetate reductase
MDDSLAGVVCHDRRVIVEWGLGELPGVLARLGIERPLVITDEVFADVELPGTERRFHGAQPHADLKGVRAALEVAGDSDGLVALGGGSVIDTTKAVSKELDVPIVSVPTTYAGAEWTHWYGNRDSETRTKPAGLDARVEGIVYEVDLTMGLPAEPTGGTALNALTHAAEALYASGRTTETDEQALAGTRKISSALPRVIRDGSDRDARLELLQGAAHAGAAMLAGMAAAHGIAQVLGGRYGLPHGTMNAIALPPVLRFNLQDAATAPAIGAFADALGADDPAARVEELSALFGAGRLRDHGVPEEDLPEVAELSAARPATQANPRPVSVDDALTILRSVW